MFAQTDSATGIIDKATQSGWEAALVALVLITGMTACGFMIRWLVKRQERDSEAAEKRETRLADRVTSLETFIRDKLLEALQKAADALKLSATAQADMANVLKEHTTITRELKMVVDKLAESLEERPCFWSVEKQAELLMRAEQVVAQNRAPKQT